MNNTRCLVHSMLVAMVALLCVLPAEAARKARAGNNGKSTADVLTNLHASNQKTIRAAKLAEDRAQARDVIDFANTLVKDHTEMDEKLMDFAKSHNIELGMTAKGAAALDKKDMDNLTDIATGEQFDMQFVQMMRDEHKKMVDELTRVTKASNDAMLKEFIDEVLPTLKEHQETAEDLLDKARL